MNQTLLRFAREAKVEFNTQKIHYDHGKEKEGRKEKEGQEKEAPIVFFRKSPSGGFFFVRGIWCSSVVGCAHVVLEASIGGRECCCA